MGVHGRVWREAREEKYVVMISKLKIINTYIINYNIYVVKKGKLVAEMKTSCKWVLQSLKGFRKLFFQALFITAGERRV